MEVKLIKPCSVPTSELQPTNYGYYCNACAKSVIDYTGMTDAQMIAYINKHGYGCGKFLNTQIDRELLPGRKKRVLSIKLLYTALLTILFFRLPQLHAQEKQKIEQMPIEVDSTGCIKNYGDNRIIETPVFAFEGRKIVFGGAIAISKSIYYNLPFGIKIRKPLILRKHKYKK